MQKSDDRHLPIGRLAMSPNATEDLKLDRDGAQRLHAALAENDLLELKAVAAYSDKPGLRLFDSKPVQAVLAQNSALSTIAYEFLGSSAKPVRALLFNKGAANNWRIGWHQDRTVAVKRRLAVPGFDVWTVKDGVDHVEPPFAIISSMLTLRVHLDDTPHDNAPLLIAPRSHVIGAITADEAPAIAQRLGSVACVAGVGDVWAYATSILHASDRATAPRQRRVLHVEFAAAELPGGLEWFGV